MSNNNQHHVQYPYQDLYQHLYNNNQQNQQEDTFATTAAQPDFHLDHFDPPRQQQQQQQYTAAVTTAHRADPPAVPQLPPLRREDLTANNTTNNTTNTTTTNNKRKRVCSASNSKRRIVDDALRKNRKAITIKEPENWNWQAGYEKLKEYHKKYGTCVPNSHMDSDLKEWISAARIQRQRDRLVFAQLDQLEELDFSWKGDDDEEDTEDEEEEEEEENSDDDDDDSSSSSSSSDSSASASDKKPKARKQPKAKANASSPTVAAPLPLPTTTATTTMTTSAWDPVRKYNHKAWKKRFDQVQDYYQQHHNALPKCSKRGLGRWVDRQQHKYRQGDLCQEQIALLESVGVQWNKNKVRTKPPPPNYVAKFNTMVEELQQFKEQHDHFQVPLAKSKGYFKLAGWIKTQRFCYRHNTLSQDRIQQLEAIGFPWHASVNAANLPDAGAAVSWQEQLAKLRVFSTLNGHVNVPSTHHNHGLYKWICHQRKAYQQGTLDEASIEALESLGVVLSEEENEIEEEPPRKRQATGGTSPATATRKTTASLPTTIATTTAPQQPVRASLALAAVKSPRTATASPKPKPTILRTDQAELSHHRLRGELHREEIKLKAEQIQLQQQQQQQQRQLYTRHSDLGEEELLELVQKQATELEQERLQRQQDRVTFQQQRVQWQHDKLLLGLELQEFRSKAGSMTTVTTNTTTAKNRLHGVQHQQWQANETQLKQQTATIEAQTKQLQDQAATIQRQGEQLDKLWKLFHESVSDEED